MVSQCDVFILQPSSSVKMNCFLLRTIGTTFKKYKYILCLATFCTAFQMQSSKLPNHILYVLVFTSSCGPFISKDWMHAALSSSDPCWHGYLGVYKVSSYYIHSLRLQISVTSCTPTLLYWRTGERMWVRQGKSGCFSKKYSHVTTQRCITLNWENANFNKVKQISVAWGFLGFLLYSWISKKMENTAYSICFHCLSLGN